MTGGVEREPSEQQTRWVNLWLYAFSLITGLLENAQQIMRIYKNSSVAQSVAQI